MSFTYKWKTKPYRHQVRAVKKLLSTGYGGALLMEPRTGKTKVAIDYAAILAKGNKVRRVLVVCPLSVMGVWEEEIKKHCPFKSNVVIWDAEGRKTEPLPNKKGCINWVLINYAAFSVPAHRSDRDRMTLRKWLREWSPHLGILDESHRIKTPSAKKSYAVQSIAWAFDRSKNPQEELIPYRIIMTGTPVTKRKRVADIYSQWLFLNPHRFNDLGSYAGFKHYFSNWKQRRGYSLWLNNQNIPELKKRISKDAILVKRDECFDLPESRTEILPVQLSKNNQQVYDKMEQEMLVKLRNGEITTAQIKLVQSLRLAQITSGFAKTDEGKLYIVGDDKLETLRGLLTDFLEADEKVVIAARFRADHVRIHRLAKNKLKVPVNLVRGGQSRKKRDAEIKEFRKKPGPRLMVVQPQAASLGIDLSTASLMVWYSLTNSYVDYTQTCDRIALSKHKTTIIHLVAQDTVDEDLYATLEGDDDLAKHMLERVDYPVEGDLS